MKKLKILSLFDGMSCGQIALQRAGFEVEEYYASEIDKYAIQVTQRNFPNTIQLGDVTKVDSLDVSEIDLLIGGSPCQGFSFAGKQLNFEDPRSKLFFEFVRLLKELKPKYFLLENVKMKKESEAVITELLGVEPIEINSALVSAQNRKRLYWTNIEGVGQPEDKGIFLKDILETEGEGIIKNRGSYEPRPEKSMCLDANYHKGADNHGQRTLIAAGRMVGRKLDERGVRADGRQDLKAEQRLEINENPQKTNCLTTVQKDNLVVSAAALARAERKNYSKPKINPDKTGTLNAKNNSGQASLDSGTTWVTHPKGFYRRLTPLECERLQTVPEGYTEGVSNTQRYRVLGNGWTVDVVAHILKNMEF